MGKNILQSLLFSFNKIKIGVAYSFFRKLFFYSKPDSFALSLYG
jgi:hypothetical protein